MLPPSWRGCLPELEGKQKRRANWARAACVSISHNRYLTPFVPEPVGRISCTLCQVNRIISHRHRRESFTRSEPPAKRDEETLRGQRRSRRRECCRAEEPRRSSYGAACFGPWRFFLPMPRCGGPSRRDQHCDAGLALHCGDPPGGYFDPYPAVTALNSGFLDEDGRSLRHLAQHALLARAVPGSMFDGLADRGSRGARRSRALSSRTSNSSADMASAAIGDADSDNSRPVHIRRIIRFPAIGLMTLAVTKGAILVVNRTGPQNRAWMRGRSGARISGRHGRESSGVSGGTP